MSAAVLNPHIDGPHGSGSPGWRPLLDGDAKARAEETVEELAAALGAIWGELPADLANGAAGLAVAEDALIRSGFRREGDAAQRWLERAVQAMSATQTSASLYAGLTGVGWAAEQLRPRSPNLDPDEINNEIDELLCDLLRCSPWLDDYDLIGGLVGYGVYALERLPRPSAVLCLERIVDRLAELAQPTPHGMTWWTAPELLPPHQRELAPRGHYNLGLAHGVPGVIALLGRLCAADVAVDRARPLLEGAVRWLLAQAPPEGSGFGYWKTPAAEETSETARLAWCYGDPGVAAALLSAARDGGRPAWERAALGIGRRAASAPPDRAGVKDAGLCHGAAGLGHLFNRLWQATGEPQFRDAARSWFDQTLSLRQPGRGIAGYAAWQGGGAGGPEWRDDPGILTGAAGIALALSAACSDVAPNWDRMLLVSLPPG
jgi:lantibiotic biosynthesis protein